MSNLKGCFLHDSDHWRTPSDLYDRFMSLGYLDPCPFPSVLVSLFHDVNSFTYGVM